VQHDRHLAIKIQTITNESQIRENIHESLMFEEQLIDASNNSETCKKLLNTMRSWKNKAQTGKLQDDQRIRHCLKSTIVEYENDYSAVSYYHRQLMSKAVSSMIVDIVETNQQLDQLFVHVATQRVLKTR
jgi:hypothetical protein